METNTVAYEKKCYQYGTRKRIDDHSVLFGFWKEMFSKLTFKMLKIDDQFDTDSEKLIGGNAQSLVVMKKESICFPGTIFAVIDHENPLRVFLGHNLSEPSDYTRCQYTFGAIQYFYLNGESNGKMKFLCGADSAAFLKSEYEYFRAPHTVKYDGKTSLITEEEHHFFISGNTLIFVAQKAEDSNFYVSGALLVENQFMANFYFDTKFVPKTWDCPVNLFHNRWLSFVSINDDTVCYDLRSFKYFEAPKTANKMGEYQPETPKDLSERDHRSYLQFDRVVFANGHVHEVNLDSTLTALNAPCYEITERYGYPVCCPNCGGDVVRACFQGGSLGMSVCMHCMIRYSTSAKYWICMQIVNPFSKYYTTCNCCVKQPNYICTSTERHISDVIYKMTWDKDIDVDRNEQPSVSLYPVE